MLQSHIIEIDGVFVGAAVRTDQGYRFVATNLRLEELDSSVWPTLDDVRRLARRCFKDGVASGSFRRHTSPGGLPTGQKVH